MLVYLFNLHITRYQISCYIQGHTIPPHIMFSFQAALATCQHRILFIYFFVIVRFLVFGNMPSSGSKRLKNGSW